MAARRGPAFPARCRRHPHQTDEGAARCDQRRVDAFLEEAARQGELRRPEPTPGWDRTQPVSVFRFKAAGGES